MTWRLGLALLLWPGVAEGKRAAPPSLVGYWAYTDGPHRAGAVQAGDCGTDFGVRYKRNGTWHDLMPGDEGRWSARGFILTERITHETDAMGRRRTVNRRASWGRLRWFSRDHVNIEHGTLKLGLVRCAGRDATPRRRS